MGKESEKELRYVCVKLNHFAVYLKLTQHCKSTILQFKIKKKKKRNQLESKSNVGPRSDYHFLATNHSEKPYIH